VAYRAVQQWLSTWLWQVDAVEPGAAPAHVERALRGYLECGILAHGFARARCEDCAANFLVAFSCKGRGYPVLHDQTHGRDGGASGRCGDAIEQVLRAASRVPAPHASLGAISFVQRFGAALNEHWHFHVCVSDGHATSTLHEQEISCPALRRCLTRAREQRR